MREIYYNGVIDTGTGLDAEAMAVEDGRIAAVGSLRDVNHSEDTVFHDLEGRFVVPGFNDSHMHLLNYGHVSGPVRLSAGGKAVPRHVDRRPGLEPRLLSG